MVVRNISDHPAHAGHSASLLRALSGEAAGPGSNGPEAPPDRVSLARLMLEVAATRSRLQAEIQAAQERLEAASSSTTPAERAAHGDLAAMVLAAQRELAEIEREHRTAMTTIRDAAVTEATDLLAAAHGRAVTARERAVTLSSRITALPTSVDE